MTPLNPFYHRCSSAHEGRLLLKPCRLKISAQALAGRGLKWIGNVSFVAIRLSAVRHDKTVTARMREKVGS